MSKNNSRNDLSPHIVSLSHIGGRSTQQDKLWPSPDQPYSFDGQSDLLLVVADGAGGHQGGEVASQIAIETVVERYDTLRQQQKPKQALVNAIRDAHETIQDHQVSDFEKQNMASTVVALVLTPLSEGNGKGKPAYKICVANVGDSRAYRYRPKLPLKQLSQDHTLVQEEVRQQHLTPEQAKIHPLRHRLSQALGGKKELNIFTRAVSQVKQHDRYLLCTDGLTDVLDDAHIQTILSERAPTKQVAQSLMKEALLHAQDNVSFILLDMIPVSPDKRRLLAMSMIQSWLGKMGVVLFLALMIAFTVTVLLTQFSNRQSFAPPPPTASVNNKSPVITETRASPTQTSQQSVVQRTSNRPSPQPSATQTTGATHTASPTATPKPTATPEPTLRLNADVVGDAATAVPSPTSTPRTQIVEYRTGPDRIVFESMVGWGGQNRVCNRRSSLIAIEERVNYPYEHAIRPVGPPIVKQRGLDIYVKFDAIGTKPRACGLERYHEQVIEPNAQEGKWIIKNARLTKKVIPVHSNSQISQGGWIIYLEWR